MPLRRHYFAAADAAYAMPLLPLPHAYAFYALRAMLFLH